MSNAVEKIERKLKAIKALDLCFCDARFSGSDEREFAARGNPQCSCEPQILALLASYRELLEAVKGYQLGHTHNHSDSHFRTMGDNYGWCDFCQEKMCINEDSAREALEAAARHLGDE